MCRYGGIGKRAWFSSCHLGEGRKKMSFNEKIWDKIINENMGTGNTNETKMSGYGCLFFIILFIAAWFIIPRLGEWMSQI